MWKRLTGLILALIFAVTPGCGGNKEKKPVESKEDAADKNADGLTPEQAARVVARVGNSTITVGDVTEQINRLSPYIRRRWAAPEKRREFLQKLIRIELLSQEAIALGLENDPEVQNALKQVMIRLLVKNDLSRELLPSSVDDATLKAEYEKQSSTFHRPAEIRISQIVVDSAEAAAKLIAELSPLKDDNKLFRDRAKEMSRDKASADRGGDVGYFAQPVEGKEKELVLPVPLPVAQAAWTLKEIGDVAAAAVKTEQGFHVIKLTNRKPELNRSFESVKRLLENRLLRDLRRQKMDEFVLQLKTKAKIEIFEENLAKMQLEVPPPSAETAPGTGNDTDSTN